MAERPRRFGVAAAFAANGEAWLAKARRIEELGFDAFLIPVAPSHSSVSARHVGVRDVEAAR